MSQNDMYKLHQAITHLIQKNHTIGMTLTKRLIMH